MLAGFCVFCQEHMLTHQAGPSLSSQKPRVFKCDSCEKAFAKPSQLERHSRIHTGRDWVLLVCWEGGRW
jgi:hypothetical protein